MATLKVRKLKSMPRTGGTEAAAVCPTKSPKHSGGPQMGRMKLEVAEASALLLRSGPGAEAKILGAPAMR